MTRCPGAHSREKERDARSCISKVTPLTGGGSRIPVVRWQPSVLCQDKFNRVQHAVDYRHFLKKMCFFKIFKFIVYIYIVATPGLPRAREIERRFVGIERA